MNSQPPGVDDSAPAAAGLASDRSSPSRGAAPEKEPPSRAAIVQRLLTVALVIIGGFGVVCVVLSMVSNGVGSALAFAHYGIAGAFLVLVAGAFDLAGTLTGKKDDDRTIVISSLRLVGGAIAITCALVALGRL